MYLNEFHDPYYYTTFGLTTSAIIEGTDNSTFTNEATGTVLVDSPNTSAYLEAGHTNNAGQIFLDAGATLTLGYIFGSGTAVVNSGSIIDQSEGAGSLLILGGTSVVCTSTSVIQACTVNWRNGKFNVDGSYEATRATTVYGQTTFIGQVESFGNLVVNNNLLDLSKAHLDSTATTLSSLDLEGGKVITANDLTVTGLFTWAGGELQGVTTSGGQREGSLIAKGDLILNPNGNNYLNFLDNFLFVTQTASTVNWSAANTPGNEGVGGFGLMDGAEWDNDSTIKLTGPTVYVSSDTTSTTFNNYGTIEQLSGSNGIFAHNMLNAPGASIIVDTGSLQLGWIGDTMNNDGTLTAQTGTGLTLDLANFSQSPTGQFTADQVALNTVVGGNGYNIAGTYSARNTSVFYSPVTFTGTLIEQLNSTQHDLITNNDGYAVSLNGNLQIALGASTPPQTGTQYTILTNAPGYHGINGTFTGLPEGATVLDTTGQSSFTIRYAGGSSGQDVVLTTQQTLFSTITTVTSSPTNTSVYGQGVTFTATVSPNLPGGGTPTGTVTFMDGTAILGTGSLDGVSGNDQATFTPSSTAPLSAGTHNITAVYGADTNFTSSGSAALSQTVAATPQFQNGTLAIPGTATAATYTLTPTLPNGASAYSMKVTRTIGTTTTNLGTFAVPSGVIAVYGGPGTDAVTLSGTASKDAFTAGTGTVTEFLAQDTVQATTFTIDLNAVTALTFKGGGGSDSLTAPNQANAWTITGPNAGTLGNIATFTAIPNLTGGSVNDTFTFARGGSISGNLNGAAPTNTVDYSSFSKPVTVNLQTMKATGIGGTWTNIQSFVGTGTTDTLVAANTTNTWSISGTNTGTVAGISFAGFPNLTGGTKNDSFAFLSGGSITGNLKGVATVNTLDYSGYGNPVTVNLQAKTATALAGTWASIQSFIGTGMTNTLVGANTTNTWSISGTNAGTVGATTFSGFANLTGGTVKDTFSLSGGAGVTGIIDGGTGTNTLDDSACTTDVVINLALGNATNIGGGIANIQNANGGSGNDILVGNGMGNVLKGNGGYNILIAGGNPGTAAGTLIGGGSGDLLIGGYTDYDTNADALTSIMNIWTNGMSYDARLTVLTSASTYELNSSTVHDNEVSNTLTGSGIQGQDLFFAHLSGSNIDTTNAKKGDTVQAI